MQKMAFFPNGRLGGNIVQDVYDVGKGKHK